MPGCWRRPAGRPTRTITWKAFTTTAGAREAPGGQTSTIENVTSFTNPGELLVTDDSTTLVLEGETLDNTNGTVQVNAGTSAAVNPTLDLVNAEIDAGTVINAGLLEATGGTTSTIENVTSFTNAGELLATGDGTVLVLENEIVANSGTVQVDKNTTTRSTLDLVKAEIDGGTVTNAGLLEATGGATNPNDNVESLHHHCGCAGGARRADQHDRERHELHQPRRAAGDRRQHHAGAGG